MTVSSLVPVNSYTGNSYCKKFDFDFLIESGTELVVQHTDENGITTILKEGIDYSINEIGNKEGSYITFPLETSSYGILKENEKINLMLTLVIKQESEFRNSSYFNFNILEWTFDYIVRILQIINRKIERCIKVREGDEVINEPDKFINDLKIIEFNTKTYSSEAAVSANLAKNSETLAKDWAIKTDGKVDNADYSSKYYALETKNNALSALSDINEAYTNAVDEINDARLTGINAVDETRIDAIEEITFARTNAVKEVNTTKTNAVDNVNSVKNSATKVIQELVNKANDAAQRAENEAYKVLYPTDTINQSKALMTGNVSTNPEVFEDIKNYTHSTFDKSSLEMVGLNRNAILVNDSGILKITNGNGVARVHTECEKVELIEAYGSAIYENSETSQTILDFRFGAIDNASGISGLRLEDNERLYWSSKFSYIKLDGINKGDRFNFHVIETGEYVLLEVTYNGISKKIENTRHIDLAKMESGFAIGNLYYCSGYFYKGGIDLKSLRIKINNDEFSFNKKGIDIIKPDDYTIIGNQVNIDDMGLMKPLAPNNYIYKILNLTGNVIKFQIPFIWGGVPTTSSQFMMIVELGTEKVQAFKWSSNSSVWQFYFVHEGESNYDLPQSNLILNKQVLGEFVIDYTKNEASVTYYDDKGQIITTKQITPNVLPLINKPNVNFYVGWVRQGSSTDNIIDLNSVKVYVDGNLLYQPCLKIPYTLSNTGSKIVEAKYRDRVQDMYEQFGYAPYYTIDEENENFTLPMGEIYGMLEKTRQNLDDILRPIGKPLISMNNDTLNLDEIWLEGAKVLKSTYPKLAEVYGDTYAPLEAEDTDTYLYLPDCRNRTVWGSSDGSYGYIEAGLPNITGEFHSLPARNGNAGASGCFTVTSNGSYAADGSVDSRRVDFNASLSNNIYGKSTTVQPPAIKVRWKTRFK